MTVAVPTLAFTRPVPYLLERGKEQTLEAPVRHGATGTLQAPTAASSTFSLRRPGGDFLVSEGSVLVPSSTAQYTLTPSASETLGRNYEVQWDLDIDGVSYPIRVPAYMCDWVPRNMVSVIELYGVIPELRYRIPQAQGERGDNTGWQPQIDEAYYDLIQRLIDDGRDIWRLKDIVSARRWLLFTALKRCLLAIPFDANSNLASKEKSVIYELGRIEDDLRFVFEDEDAAVREAGRPVTRLAPVGRPSC